MLDLRLGRLSLRFGFSFFLLLAVLLLWDQQRLMLAVLLAVVLHELGHLLALTALGVPLRGVVFTGSGIHIQRGRYTGGSLAAELSIHLAGVAVNLLLAGVFSLLPLGLPGAYFSLVNLLLGCLHLIPAGNLDGANALGCLLARRCTDTCTRMLLRLMSLGCLGLLLWQMARAASLLNLSAVVLWCYLLVCTLREY